jgi:hypothetical protein
VIVLQQYSRTVRLVVTMICHHDKLAMCSIVGRTGSPHLERVDASISREVLKKAQSALMAGAQVHGIVGPCPDMRNQWDEIDRDLQ